MVRLDIVVELVGIIVVVVVILISNACVSCKLIVAYFIHKGALRV